MGLQDLQTFIESGSIPGSCVAVDIVKIGRSFANKARKAQKFGNAGGYNHGELSLVLDAECCLDRLYGGFYSDWACGGQWGHMLTFLSQFFEIAHQNNIDMTVFFDGTSDEARMKEWVEKQLQTREKIASVLKHIASKGTPPPKIWWIPPGALSSVLRMAFRTLHIPVGVSSENHKLEVLQYMAESGNTGLVADDAEYVAFQPPRYFSSKQLKLRFKGNIETKEYMTKELLKGLELPKDRLCVLISLLGTSFLPAARLEDLYTGRMGLTNYKAGSISNGELVRGVANFVKNLTQQDNVDAVVSEILGSEKDPRASALKQSIIYYYNGTKGLSKPFKEKKNNAKKNKEKKEKAAGGEKKDKTEGSGVAGESKEEEPCDELANEPDLDTSQLASEGIANELDNLSRYKEGSQVLSSEIKVDIATAATTNGVSEENGVSGEGEKKEAAPSSSTEKKEPKPKSGNKAKKNSKSSGAGNRPDLPNVPTEVLRTVAERHAQGAMSPLVYQIYTHAEVRLPVLLENEDEVPNCHLFYRPIRQKVYAILFNLHHHTFMAIKNKSDKKPDIRIKEWIWSKSNEYVKGDWVRAEPLKWGVPTVQRLWFGTTVDDRRRRLRAFLTCMRSDSNLMLQTEYVPQHLLLMACVLRYIMTFTEKRILRRPELDAFIVTAVSPEVMNSEHIQDLQLPLVTPRGVQLSTLFMTGVDTALLVNDACGAPIPWIMNCPWLFFDGKLFNYYLSKASQSKNVEELCDHRISIVVKVDKMRQAILEGINYQFARPPSSFGTPYPSAQGQMLQGGPHHGMMRGGGLMPLPGNNMRNGNNSGGFYNTGGYHQGGGGFQSSYQNSGGSSGYHSGRNSYRSGGGRGGPSHHVNQGGAGGKLEVAGVVVGQWGANYSFPSVPPSRGGGLLMQPHMNSMGYPGSNYRSSRPSYSTNMMRRRPIRVPPPVRRRPAGVGGNARGGNTAKPKPGGRGMTVVNPNTGETKLASDILDENKKILTGKVEASSDQIRNGETAGQFETSQLSAVTA
uniref:Constitutive coactivator of PPAR-gamma-like protein 1 homolog n=1 Tax=Cacopsylla melanoneura TaxID=428564 RepID=A0A8D8L9J7_9HEMI